MFVPFRSSKKGLDFDWTESMISWLVVIIIFIAVAILTGQCSGEIDTPVQRTIGEASASVGALRATTLIADMTPQEFLLGVPIRQLQQQQAAAQFFTHLSASETVGAYVADYGTSSTELCAFARAINLHTAFANYDVAVFGPDQDLLYRELLSWHESVLYVPTVDAQYIALFVYPEDLLALQECYVAGGAP